MGALDGRVAIITGAGLVKEFTDASGQAAVLHPAGMDLGPKPLPPNFSTLPREQRAEVLLEAGYLP